MNDAANWTKLLLEKQRQHAEADRATQVLRQDQLNQAFDAAGGIAGAMRKYREDAIAEKLRDEASPSKATPGATAKTLARERLRNATRPGLGAWLLPASARISPAPEAGASPARAVSTARPAAALPAAGVPGPFMKAPDSIGSGARTVWNQPPPAAAVNYLLANPGTAAAFNAKYGAGTAEAHLV